MLLNATYRSFFITFFFFPFPPCTNCKQMVCVCAVVMYSCAYMYLIVSSGVTFHSSVRANIVTRWVKLAPSGALVMRGGFIFTFMFFLKESERERKKKKLFFKLLSFISEV